MLDDLVGLLNHAAARAKGGAAVVAQRALDVVSVPKLLPRSGGAARVKQRMLAEAPQVVLADRAHVLRALAGKTAEHSHAVAEFCAASA